MLLPSGLNLDLPDLNRIQAALISQAENKFQNHVLTNLTEIITKKIPSNMPKISETCLKGNVIVATLQAKVTF